jgi:hypothetical protein
MVTSETINARERVRAGELGPVASDDNTVHGVAGSHKHLPPDSKPIHALAAGVGTRHTSQGGKIAGQEARQITALAEGREVTSPDAFKFPIRDQVPYQPEGTARSPIHQDNPGFSSAPRATGYVLSTDSKADVPWKSKPSPRR